jgi:uncharacterized protein
MNVGLLTLYLHLPGCTSLKEKRRRLKPILIHMQRKFNISVAEIDRQDTWQEAVIACALVSNDKSHTHRSLQEVTRWVENSCPDSSLVTEHLEIL